MRKHFLHLRVHGGESLCFLLSLTCMRLDFLRFYWTTVSFLYPITFRALSNIVDYQQAVGYTDNQAHNNIDFLPWFLQQMKQAETKYGKRLLDYLDIHVKLLLKARVDHVTDTL
jgi:hypothetical protein